MIFSAEVVFEKILDATIVARRQLIEPAGEVVDDNITGASENILITSDSLDDTILRFRHSLSLGFGVVRFSPLADL